MNISSSSQFTSSSIASLSSANSVSQLRLGQPQIENRGSVIQPINKSVAVAATKSNQNSSNKQTAPVESDTSPLAQKKDQQDAQSEALERRLIQELAARDREVRNHERAHAAVGGQYAGSPKYTFERGPDGINYAVGGEVSISTGAVSGDPQATIQKAQVVRRAALAPSEPSAQDRSVAAQATQLESQARIELQNLEAEKRLVEAEAAKARIENRQANTPSTSQTAEFDDASISAFNSQQELAAGNTESRAQRLSDELNLRVSRADPFGVSEPGQVFSQYA